MSKWRPVNGQIPALPELAFAGTPTSPEDPASNARRRAWQQRVFAGSHSDAEDAAEALPQCTVTVLPARDDVHVVFGAPVSLQATRDIDGLARLVARWPAVSAVHVVDFGRDSAALVEQLTSHGITAVTTPAQFESVVLLRSAGEWFLDVEHASGARAELRFGRDVAGLVDAVRRVHVSEQPVEFSAKRARRAEVTPLLDAYGIRWRVDKACDFDRFDGERAKSAGMSMRMSVKKYGWMLLRWAVGDDKHKLALTVNNDGWNQLAKATRMAVCDEQPAYCLLSRDDIGMLVVLVPAPNGDQLRVELWFTEDGWWEGVPESPRGDDLRAHWVGPRRALAKIVLESSRSLIAAAGWDGVQDLWGADAPFAELDRIESWLRHKN